MCLIVDWCCERAQNMSNKGKREHQKIKPYIVLEYLMRNSDEQHAIPASDIVNYLQEDCGIDAERCAIKHKQKYPQFIGSIRANKLGVFIASA